MAKVYVVAIAFGTFAGASGEIYHFNPAADDDRYRFPLIDEEDLRAARDRAFIAPDERGRSDRPDGRGGAGVAAGGRFVADQSRQVAGYGQPNMIPASEIARGRSGVGDEGSDARNDGLSVIDGAGGVGDGVTVGEGEGDNDDPGAGAGEGAGQGQDDDGDDDDGVDDDSDAAPPPAAAKPKPNRAPAGGKSSRS